MDNEPPQTSKRGRLMGKLFGARDRKTSNNFEDHGDQVNDFLRGPTDKLDVSHAGPPVLTKLDTRSVTRYPNALNVDLNVKSNSQQSLPLRTHSPRTRGNPRRKGLVVSFADTLPEIIGEGGDECPTPTIEIGQRRHLQTPSQQPQIRSPGRPPDAFDVHRAPSKASPPAQSDGGFVPTPLRRAQTGYSSISEPEPQARLQPPQPPTPRALPAGNDASAPYLGSPAIPRDEKRKSFIESQQAHMREAEGKAFVQAVRSASATGQPNWEEKKDVGAWQDSPELRAPPQYVAGPEASPPEKRPRQFGVEQSPASTFSNASSMAQRQYSIRRPDYSNGSPTSPQKSTTSSVRDVSTPSDEPLREFAQRTRHLFELFRLHSESVRPLMSSPTDSLARTALWWFLKGRMSLEAAVRDHPSTPEAQRSNDMLRQQANADLAKGYWIVEDVLPEILQARSDSQNHEVQDVRKTVIASMRKLTDSMKRNGFLPPEDAILSQTLHLSIWVEYPQISQDIMMLLWGYSGGSALMAQQRPSPPMEIMDSLPLGDTQNAFSYGRVPADVFLMEKGAENQHLYFPSMLSMVRPLNEMSLMFVVASQDGSVQLKVQHNKNAGPTWNDLQWQNTSCTLELKLPRGFLVCIKLAPADYKMLWNMYDFGEKVQATLFPRKDEQLVFQSTLKAVQYFDSDPQSRQFPKEAVSGCEVAMFERVIRENAATGPRLHHRGFRIAIVTGPKTRTLSGVNHAFTPAAPTQFGFLRGEGETPALLLRFDNGRSKGSMVLSFADDRERLSMHGLLLGTQLRPDEMKYSEVPLVGFSISQRLGDSEGLACLKKQPWQRVTVANVEDAGDEEVPTVLAERLRAMLDFKIGSLTDRINVAPGELKIRLDVKDTTRLSVLRPAQQDMTIAVSEAQVARELPRELTEAIKILQSGPTVRNYHFSSLRDLHDFQAAVTGQKVLFDGVAAAFAISRRRMVVPIHKKWEAGATRIQVVQHGTIMQLLAFFEDFHHGHCMGFVLKGTDVFEAVKSGGKAGIKIDDAKFPLPKVTAEGAEPTLDASFVCLDLPDLPGEHDDISILFESDTDRDRLATCLPAPVRGSRLDKFLNK